MIAESRKMYRKCFVTVGTTRFDALCDAILSSENLKILHSLGCEKLVVQIGNSDQEPREFTENGIDVTTYRFKDSIGADIIDADLVISHAGAGSCLEVLEAGKPLLVVVNEDLMDNHQLELAEQLHEDGHLYYCTCDTLNDTLLSVDFKLLKPFGAPVTGKFVEYLDWFLGFRSVK